MSNNGEKNRENLENPNKSEQKPQQDLRQKVANNVGPLATKQGPKK